MKALHEKVNIVPILAKADTLTPTEVKKKKIKASLYINETVASKQILTQLIYQILSEQINSTCITTDQIIGTLTVKIHIFTLDFLLCVFPHRSEKRLSSTVSRYTSSPTVTLTKMKNLNSRIPS